MALVTCPGSGSDDVEGACSTGADGLAIRCLACGRTFTREPTLPCRRCGSTDVAVRSFTGWGYDDIDEARDDPRGGSWSYYDREEYRCMKCDLAWRNVTAGAALRPESGRLIKQERLLPQQC